MDGNYSLITGGSNGIGLAIARGRVAWGEKVLILDRVEPPQDLVSEFVCVDLSDMDGLQKTLKDLNARLSVARIVNCAGAALLAPIETLDKEDFSKSMDIDVLAPALIVQAALPAMKRAEFGRIVNISSRSALGRGLRTSYASSKGALITATRVWALELAEHGITVNAIGPGPIETELYRAANPPESEVTQRVIASVPVKRLGKPEDIALATDYFLDKRAGFVTGQTLFICGGLTIGGVSV